jgi:signal transduction histidine kinase
MIRKLQRKFIVITMGSLLVVMLILIGLTNVINLIHTDRKINGAITILTENQGKFPNFEKDNLKRGKPRFGFEMNPETPFETRYFIVKMDMDGSVVQIDTSHIAAVSSEDARDYASEIVNTGKENGFEGIYKYKVVEQSDGYLLVFMDCRIQLQTAATFLFISCIVAFVTLFLMFLLVSIFSRKAIKPFIENAEKQKLFITDAGHEIKTPLGIISANADVLELTNGENEWINSIRNQVVRLDKLVRNLLILSKMDEETIKLAFSELNLSEIVAKITGSFTPVAEAKNINLRIDIQPGIKLNGDESSIEQLISTLVDNAMKYSSEEGNVKITLTSSKKGTKLEVFNTSENLNIENLDKLFDRFYRADSSRSRETGGYGIGLSIAKSIVEAHQGKISVKSEDGRSICFTVIL